MENQKEALKAADVAQILGCSKQTIYRMVKAGKLTPSFRVGREYRFTPEEIGRYKAVSQELLIVE